VKAIGRFVLAVLAGGVTMFIWGAISHMTLLKGAGFSYLANDDAVAAELSRSLPHDGLYFLPSADFGGKATDAENAAFEARFRAGPTGLIVFHRSGSGPVTPRKLLKQFFSELLAAAIGGFVLLRFAAPYGLRVLTMGMVGAFGVFSISTIYWNWYGFPDAFFVAQLVDKVVGWLVAGASMAALLPAADARKEAARTGAVR
jgi:hypothetical protein